MGPNRTAGALLIGALARLGVGGCRIVHVPHAGSAGSRRTGHALRARLEGAIGAAVAVADTPGALGTSLGQRKRQRNARGRGQDTSLAPELATKRLALLKEAFPKTARVAVLWNSAIPPAEVALKELRAAAPALGVDLQFVEVPGPPGFAEAFAAISENAPTRCSYFPIR